MGMIRGLRLMNALVAGTLTGSQLEALLADGRLGEFQQLLSMPGQAQLLANSGVLEEVMGSPTARGAIVRSPVMLRAVKAVPEAVTAFASSKPMLDALYASPTALAAFLPGGAVSVLSVNDGMLTVDGSDEVTAWKNALTGATFATNGRPNRDTVDTLNGYPTVAFNGTTDLVILGGASKDYALAIVFKRTSDSKGALLGGQSSTNSLPGVFNTYNQAHVAGTNSGILSYSRVAPTNEWRVLTLRFTRTTGQVWSAMNGSTEVVSAENASNANYFPSWAQGMFIGRSLYNYGGSLAQSWFEGKIAEVMVLDPDTPAADVLALNKFLCTKYGIV